MVTLQPTIHDSGITLLGNAFLGNLLINPVRVSPHVRADLSKFNSRRGVFLYRLLEGLIEFPIIEEDVGVVIPPVEVTLHGLHGLENTIQLLVSCEDNKCGIGSGLAGIGLEAAGNEDLVVLFADFSRYIHR